MNKKIYAEIIDRYNENELTKEEFETLINEMTKELESPEKEYYRIICYFKKNYYIPKDNRDYLIANAHIILESDIFTDIEKDKIKCSLMNTYLSNYEYKEAEKYASELMKLNSEDFIILKDLANYYTKTRRYELAKLLYTIITNSTDSLFCSNDYTNYKDIVSGNRREYLPATIENKNKYIEFLNELGIEVIEREKKESNQPPKIKREDYPPLIETKEKNFKNFVAFDFETTGLNSGRDAIIEIGAIKVVNGEIVETKEFIFQELVKPYKQKIHEDVEQITGISNYMVKDARQIWEVFSDFVDFIGDEILIGYNCRHFDNAFLVRAGRLSNIIIKNQFLDVMELVREKRFKIPTQNIKLNTVAEFFGIENPQAHRALADAITTAKLYLKLLELENK